MINLPAILICSRIKRSTLFQPMSSNAAPVRYQGRVSPTKGIGRTIRILSRSALRSNWMIKGANSNASTARTPSNLTKHSAAIERATGGRMVAVEARSIPPIGLQTRKKRWTGGEDSEASFESTKKRCHLMIQQPRLEMANLFDLNSPAGVDGDAELDSCSWVCLSGNIAS